MTVNSFRVVKSFQIFENQPVGLLVVADFKAIEPFTLDNRMKGFNACIIPKYPKCKHYPAKTESSINDFRYGCRFSMQSTFYTPHKQRLAHFLHPVIVVGNCDRMCIAPLFNRHIFRMSLTILDHACSLTESAIPCN